MLPTGCSALLTALAVALLATASGVRGLQCPDSNWVESDDACYKWFTSPNFWYVAEQTCVSHGGHLVSIGSQREHKLVGRLSNCTHAWIGRFGADLYRLSNISSYAWTDASPASRFQRHNFSQLDTIHKPLIRTDGDWWLNSLYHESHPFVCKVQNLSTANSEWKLNCPDGWSLFQHHCYIIPNLEANFNEANFYCQRKSSQLVSVMSEAELRYINTLDLGSDRCEPSLGTVWIGLIKLNPCFPDEGGRELCYQWTDFSGKHLGFPRWETGHPNSQDWTVNCVTLNGDRLTSDKCHNRHRFVCKAPVNGTNPPPHVPDMLAAFDFRKGLQNLINPGTYPVRDEFGIHRDSSDGACFTRPASYQIGTEANLNQTIMEERQWTMFFSVKYVNFTATDSISFVAIGRESMYDWNFRDFPLIVNSTHNYWQPRIVDVSVSLKNLTRWWSPTEHSFHLNITSHRRDTWNDFVITVTDLRPEMVVNKEAFGPYNDYSQPVGAVPTDREKLFFGNVGCKHHWNWYPAEKTVVCARCFGLARKRLSQQELQSVFARYCD